MDHPSACTPRSQPLANRLTQPVRLLLGAGGLPLLLAAGPPTGPDTSQVRQWEQRGADLLRQGRYDSARPFASKTWWCAVAWAVLGLLMAAPESAATQGPSGSCLLKKAQILAAAAQYDAAETACYQATDAYRRAGYLDGQQAALTSWPPWPRRPFMPAPPGGASRRLSPSAATGKTKRLRFNSPSYSRTD